MLKNGGFLAHRNHRGVEMSQKSGTPKLSSERIVKDIRRATRKQYSAEEKIRIVRQNALPANLVSGGKLRSQTTIPASGRRIFLRRVHSSQRYPHGSSGFCGDRQPSTGIEVKMKVFLMPSSPSVPPEARHPCRT